MATALTALMLLAAVPPAAAQTAEPSSLPPLGMSVGSIAPLKAAGAPPKYGSYWVGDWILSSGWGGFDNAMRTAKAAGVTPVIYHYYWGDSISPSCFDADGCDGRTEAKWHQLTDQLVDRLRMHFGDREVLVVLENEFNKGGITGTYAPTFDTKLEAVAKKLKAVSGVKLVLGFGAWAESNWVKFPKSAAQSEYIGFQMMRASTKDTETSYRAAADRSAYLTNHIAEKFNKPSFLYDVALSSYPDASWEKIQAETLDAIFQSLKTSGNTGLQGVVYRSLNDHYMSPANYYGYAESHWGLRTKDSVPKPAFDVWLKHATAQASEPAPATPNVPGAYEAESMPATKGGKRNDAQASGGAAWNLWSNGHLSHTLVAEKAERVRISVVAMGQSAGGVDPRMEVRLDGGLVHAASVAPNAYRAYETEVDLRSGSTLLTIHFTNDAVIGTEDRNLILDVVRVAAAPADAPPTASFSSSATGLEVAFDASASSDPEGQALSYSWSLGDGATASGATPTHRYAQDGAYDVTLTVSDGAHSASTTAQVQVTRPNSAPSASFTASMRELAGVFDASASADADGDELTYSWSMGDGQTASGVRVQHTYARGGDHVVTLTVSDGRLSATSSQTVTAIRPNTAPTAAFTAGATHLAAAFDASGSSDADGDALSYAWSFGDGTTGTGVRPSKSYAAPGTYTVTLTVSDGKATASATRTLQVTYPAPVARAAASGSDSRFSFDGSGSYDPAGGALSYAWSFGDGNTATGPTATNVYAKPGNYTVTLTVTNRFGGSDSTTLQVSVAPPAPYAATFTPRNGNNYWVQVKVDANAPTQAVCASVNGGACQALQLKSWGDWAASFHVPTGAKIVFTATSAKGERVVSGAYLWPSGEPAPEPFSARFTPHGGNNWWVQTKVDANQRVSSVCASVNGGKCQALQLKSWGSWADSFHVPTGSKVVFTATSTTGEKASSTAYTWPVK